MPPYLVRFRGDGTTLAQQRVGIFVASSIGQLASIVDECCNIDLCELAEIGAGGIMQPDPAVAVPTKKATADVETDEILKGTTLTDWQSATIHGFRKTLVFKSLEEALKEEMGIESAP